MKLGDLFPDFKAETSFGTIESFHDWVGNSWCILFSHPADFTPVCTTELAKAVQLFPEFKKRNVKMIALSCDSAESHKKWKEDIICFGQQNKTLGSDIKIENFPFPIIADDKRVLAHQLEMLDPEEIGKDGIALTARAVFVVDSTKKLKLSILYPATTGRNFDEILRVIDSLQLTAVKKVATPVNWNVGDKCMVIPSLSSEEVKNIFGDDVESIDLPSKKQYLRMTPMPQ
uniref:Thioredoxin domain-containing protein n=1 Tax=Rhabditophanes sp. KR3021 TaxID=114890 RepID=A0AC35TRQ2_9BILA